MSDDETQSNDEGNSPKALREALEKANKQLAEYKKLAEDAAEEKRRESLSAILKAKGLKETALNHYSGDVSEEAVTQWATDLGLLGSEPNEAESAELEAVRRAAAAAGDSASTLGVGATRPGGPVVGDPQKVTELLRTGNLSYEDYVRLGIFPADPNVI